MTHAKEIKKLEKNMVDDWTRGCQVQRVIDGDTVIVLIDHGMRIRSEQSIRLKDVNAPEIFSGEDKINGLAIKNLLITLIENHLSHPNSNLFPFWVTTEKDKQSFNRYVGVIVCRTCDENLNTTMNLTI